MSSHARQGLASFAEMQRMLDRDLKAGLIDSQTHDKYSEIFNNVYSEYKLSRTQLRLLKVSVKERLHALRQSARLDRETELYNKKEFEQYIVPRYLRDVARDKRQWHDRRSDSAALVSLDLDNFKPVNDAEDLGLGHSVGDEMLKVLAHLLKTQIRHIAPVVKPEIAKPFLDNRPWDESKPCGFPARVGGDEFALLLTGISRYTQAHFPASRIQMMYKGHNWADINELLPRFRPSVSVGVVVLRLSGIKNCQRIADSLPYARSVAKAWKDCTNQKMAYVKQNRLDQVLTAEVDFVDGKFVEIELSGGLSLEPVQVPSA